ncbi:MAG: hypothetical protein ACRBB4_10275 [Neptuniibacter sp.]
MKDSKVISAVEALSKNLENPIDLIKIGERMQKHYTLEKFSKSLKKHYKGLSKSDVMHTVTQGNNTAVLLKSNSTLIYSHEHQAFFFDFEAPVELKGAVHYFGLGLSPTIQDRPNYQSNCSLEKNGVVYISPPKQQLFFNGTESFCEYNGYYYSKENDKITIKRVDQIGQGYSVLEGDFHEFLLWLKSKS